VFNPATKEYVSSAEVRIQGINLVAVTESDGSFRFPNVPAGLAVISVTYIGTISEPKSVQVEPEERRRSRLMLRAPRTERRAPTC